MKKSQILKQIRENCLDCMGGFENEVKHCTSKLCKLKPFRFGKDPEPNQHRANIARTRDFQIKRHPEHENAV